MCNSVDRVDSVDAVMVYTEWKTASGIYHKMCCAEIEVENGWLNSDNSRSCLGLQIMKKTERSVLH